MINVAYLDKKIGWIIYPISGVSFIFFANDNDFKTLIQFPTFKWDIVFSLVVVSIIGYYLAWLVRFLDKNKSWEKYFTKRATLQFLYGIVAPLTLVFGLELIYLKIINIDLGQSSIFNLELPLSFLYLFIINLLYYLNYVSVTYRKNLEEKNSPKILTKQVKILSGAKESLMLLKNIAFIKSEDKVLWLNTFEGRQILINGTLKDWESQLPKDFFYRLNRHIIVHRNAITGTESTKTRRLLVMLNNSNEGFYLPKTRITDFRDWWRG